MLLEHPSRPDRRMGFRPLCDMVELWQALFVDLQQTPPERLTEMGEAVLLALRALQAVDAPKEELAAALAELPGLLDDLPDEARAAIEKALYYLYLLIRHKRELEEQDELFEVVDAAVERHVGEREECKMTGAEASLRKGREEGRNEGRQKGREEGRQEGREEGREEGARPVIGFDCRHIRLGAAGGRRPCAGPIRRGDCARAQQILAADAVEALGLSIRWIQQCAPAEIRQAPPNPRRHGAIARPVRPGRRP